MMMSILMIMLMMMLLLLMAVALQASFSSPLEVKVTSWWTSTAVHDLSSYRFMSQASTPAWNRNSAGSKPTHLRDIKPKWFVWITELQTIIQTYSQTPCVTQREAQKLKGSRPATSHVCNTRLAIQHNGRHVHAHVYFHAFSIFYYYYLNLKNIDLT